MRTSTTVPVYSNEYDVGHAAHSQSSSTAAQPWNHHGRTGGSLHILRSAAESLDRTLAWRMAHLQVVCERPGQASVGRRCANDPNPSGAPPLSAPALGRSGQERCMIMNTNRPHICRRASPKCPVGDIFDYASIPDAVCVVRSPAIFCSLPPHRVTLLVRCICAPLPR